MNEKTLLWIVAAVVVLCLMARRVGPSLLTGGCSIFAPLEPPDSYCHSKAGRDR